MNDESFKMWKHFTTRNFIPSALFVGAVSNLINFIILSRPRIKASSIKIYLTVLAFTDTFLLVSILLISKQFYEDAHSQTQEIYWQTFRLTQWFYTSFNYISVYLTLFISLDRYWSMKQQKKVDENSSSCRISNARNTASMILFICFLLSITAAFEFKLDIKELNCSRQIASSTNVIDNSIILPLLMKNQSDNKTDEDKIYSFNTTKLTHKTDNETFSQQSHITCPSFHLFPVESDLARNKFYRIIFKPIATFLHIVPFVVMVFVIWKLARYQHQHHPLQENKHSTDNVIQKNKQGRLVITLVVIFLICHTPNAVYTFYKNFHLAPQHDDHDSEAMKIKNFILAFKILSLTLMCINCCWKTLIYIATYEEFRETILNLTSCSQPTNPSVVVSSDEREFRKSLPQIFLSDSNKTLILNPKEVEIIKLPSQRKLSFPVTNISLSGAYALRRMSVNVPSASYVIQPKVHNCNETKRNQQINRHSSMRTPRNREQSQLDPSPSQSNLTRSRSMTIQMKHFKHSPNCKLRKKFEV